MSRAYGLTERVRDDVVRVAGNLEPRVTIVRYDSARDTQ